MDKDEQQKQQTSDIQHSLLDWLKPNFSLGGLLGMGFWTLLFVGILYFAMETYKPLRDWVERKLPEKWQLGINQMVQGLGLPAVFPEASIEGYLGKLDANSDDPQKETIRSDFMSQLGDSGKDMAPVINAITEDKQTALDFVKLVLDSNTVNGKRPAMPTKEMILSPQTIYALLTQKPPALARKIVDALPAAQPGAAPSSSTQTLIASITTILKDRTKFNAILSGDSFDVTMDALAKVSPAMGLSIDANALKSFVKTVGITDGQPNDTLYNLVTQLVASGGDPAQMKQAVGQLLLDPNVQAHPEALASLAKGITLPAAPTDGSDDKYSALRQNLEMLQYNSAPVIKLLKDLGPEKASALLDGLMNTPDGQPISVTYQGKDYDMLSFALGPENRAAFDAFMSSGGGLDLAHVHPDELRTEIQQYRDLPPAHKEDLQDALAAGMDIGKIRDMLMTNGKLDASKLTDVLLDDSARQFMEQQIAKARAKYGDKEVNNKLLGFNGILSIDNLKLCFAAGFQLGHTGADQGNTKTVMTALIAAMTGTDAHATDAFKQLNAKQLSDFFGNDKNVTPLLGLIDSLDVSHLPQAQKDLVATLRQHFLVVDKSGHVVHGIAHALSDVKEAGIALNVVQNPNEWFYNNPLNELCIFGKDAPDLQALQQSLNAVKQYNIAHSGQGRNPTDAPGKNQPAFNPIPPLM